jgi:hypothetical protein
VQGGHPNGTNIIDLDPQFTAPYTGTPANFDASAYDYHPLSSSPAINAGNNDLVPADALFDLEGEERIQGGVVDLGCYESELTVGLAEHGMLHIADPGANGAFAVEVHALSGQLVARITVQQGMTPLALPAGMYVARAEGLQPLRFVVAGR